MTAASSESAWTQKTATCTKVSWSLVRTKPLGSLGKPWPNTTWTMTNLKTMNCYRGSQSIKNSESQIMETFSTPWTQLPTMTSCWESVASQKPAARKAPRAWLYHAWSRKASKSPRASSEKTLKLLEIIQSHFINPNSIIWIFYPMDFLRYRASVFWKEATPAFPVLWSFYNRQLWFLQGLP